MPPRSPYRSVTEELQNPTLEATYGSVKQMVRRIAKEAPDYNAGIDSVYDVDAQLNEWYQLGYKLFATHYLGTTQSTYDMMYILVRSV